MSNLSFEISHFTGDTTRILFSLQRPFPSLDWVDLRFGRKILKSYIVNKPGTFLWNTYFLSNFCFVICHLMGKCLRSFANFVRSLILSPSRIARANKTQSVFTHWRVPFEFQIPTLIRQRAIFFFRRIQNPYRPSHFTYFSVTDIDSCFILELDMLNIPFSVGWTK